MNTETLKFHFYSMLHFIYIHHTFLLCDEDMYCITTTHKALKLELMTGGEDKKVSFILKR